MDLTPRTSPGPTETAPAPPRRRRRWWPMAVLAGVLAAGAIVLFQGLSSATVYFCNADEIGRRGECEPGERFRLQGTVVEGSVEQVDPGDVRRFEVEYNGAVVPVSYQGDPGGIFRENIPVVVEGRMGDDGVFAGDRVLVKHTEQYREENEDRVRDYDQ